MSVLSLLSAPARARAAQRQLAACRSQARLMLEHHDRHLFALLAHAAGTGCACPPDCETCWAITQALKEADA